jgi:hypothetical protein
MYILLWSKFHVHGICLTIPFTYYHVAPVIASHISAYCPSYFFSLNSFFFLSIFTCNALYFLLLILSMFYIVFYQIM